MTLFLIAALRAIVEMLGLCLMGQGVLALLSGKSKHTNPVYSLFDILTGAPRRIVARVLPGNLSEATIGFLTFGLLFFFWIGLAIFRKFI